MAVIASELKVGQWIARKPAGRMCRIEAIREDGWVKVWDNCFWTGWVSPKTLERDWRIPGTSA